MTLEEMRNQFEAQGLTREEVDGRMAELFKTGTPVTVFNEDAGVITKAKHVVDGFVCVTYQSENGTKVRAHIALKDVSQRLVK
jgi:hypothetical protein